MAHVAPKLGIVVQARGNCLKPASSGVSKPAISGVTIQSSWTVSIGTTLTYPLSQAKPDVRVFASPIAVRKLARHLMRANHYCLAPASMRISTILS